MDKHCEGCKYRLFHSADNFKTYGFCTYEKILEQTFIDNHDDNFVSYAADILNKLKNGKTQGHIPSCMIVQSYYSGKCPFRKEEVTIHFANDNGSGIAISNGNPISNNLCINTDKIILRHKELDIEFDLDSKRLEEAESITINGIKFVKEN